MEEPEEEVLGEEGGAAHRREHSDESLLSVSGGRRAEVGQQEEEEEEEDDDDDDEDDDGYKEEDEVEIDGEDHSNTKDHGANGSSLAMSTLSQSPMASSRSRGRSKSPRSSKSSSKKKKGSKSPKGGKKSKSPRRSKKKGSGKSKSPGRGSSKKRSKSPKRRSSDDSGTPQRDSSSPRSVKSTSSKKSGKGKKKKRKTAGKGKRGRGASSRDSPDNVTTQELQAVLNLTVYQARIKDLEHQLRRTRLLNAQAIKTKDEANEAKDFVGKELQVELEHQQSVIQELVTKAAEDRRMRRKEEQKLRNEIDRQAEALRTITEEATQCRQLLHDKRIVFAEAEAVVATHEKLVRENQELRDQLERKEALVKEYEDRYTILHKASLEATISHRTSRGKNGQEGTKVGGATGLIPVLLEGMKLFPHDKIMQREMCMLITHIAFTPEDYILMSEYEGLELILAALQNHRTHKALVASGLRMLWKFATAKEQLRDKLRSSSALALVLNILTVIPPGSVRRLEFFAGRTIAFLLPEEVSMNCPAELVAEEQAVTHSKTRRASDLALPFIGTQDLTSTMGSTYTSKGRYLNMALPGANGESGELTMTTRDLIKILLTVLMWSVSELVEFNAPAAEKQRRWMEAEERTEGVVASQQQEGEDGIKGTPRRRVPWKGDEKEGGLCWKANPDLARTLARDALVALVAAIEGKDDGSGCRQLAFSDTAMQIIVRTWRAFFDVVDVVVASCLLIRHSLTDEPVKRAEQLTLLNAAGLDKVLKASERRHKLDAQVVSEVITLSRIFFVDLRV